MKKRYIVKWNRQLDKIIQERADQLGLTYSEYIKFAIIKDITDVTFKKRDKDL